MIKMTLSLRKFLWKFHKDIYTQVLFGHIELFTQELEEEYLNWCKTDEGRSYLEGGSNYTQGDK